MPSIMGLMQAFGDEEKADAWIRRVMDTSDGDNGVLGLLEMLGKNFSCKRSFIWEQDEQARCIESYEWDEERGGSRPKRNRYNEFEELFHWLKEPFSNGQPVFVRDVEELRGMLPLTYALLKSWGVESGAMVPLLSEKKIVGMLGVENPDWEHANALVPLLFLISAFVVRAIQNDRLVERMNYLSYHDPLTNCYNRHAFDEKVRKTSYAGMLGVVYGDITGLKKTNDTLGHEAGDALILRCVHLMETVFAGYDLYRVGGDEFVIVCDGIKRNLFETKVSELRMAFKISEDTMAIGATWSECEASPSTLLREAEHGMYADKAEYYATLNPISGERRDRRRAPQFNMVHFAGSEESGLLLNKYLASNEFNLSYFIEALSLQDTGVYFGDLRTNVFFVNDRLRDAFGFHSNLVVDLLTAWEKVIVTKADLQLYREDLARIMKNRLKVHDMRYRVRDRSGNEYWIRCTGKIHWEDESANPIFFAGMVTKLDYEFVIDPTTDFPREQGAVAQLRNIFGQGKRCSCLGFRLSNFREINEMNGRVLSDMLLRDISLELSQKFHDRMLFYRLDGLRFMAIAHPDCPIQADEDVKFIKSMVERLYHDYGVNVRVPCFCGIIKEMNPGMDAQEIINAMLNLLDMAKDSPDEEYVVYSQQNVDKRRSHSRMMMDLNSDVENDFVNFRTVVQPTVTTEDMRVHSGEMLLRWRYGGKDVSPGIFIPILERGHQILSVGRWVFEQAVQTAKRIRAYDPDFVLGVNVSYLQVLDPEFLPFMERTLLKWGVDGRHLLVEITETNYNESPRTLQKFLDACKALGMQLALDDFGTGYSSLELLLKHTSDVVKLDRSLMKEMAISKTSNDFITSIVYACHKFGKRVCVEGVETDFELRNVLEAGCDFVQGFYFYRPMEMVDFYRLLANDSGGVHHVGEKP